MPPNSKNVWDGRPPFPLNKESSKPLPGTARIASGCSGSLRTGTPFFIRHSRVVRILHNPSPCSVPPMRHKAGVVRETPAFRLEDPMSIKSRLRPVAKRFPYLNFGTQRIKALEAERNRLTEERGLLAEALLTV